MVRTLVITPGSNEKRDMVAEPARASDLASAKRRQQVAERLSALACPAIAMYTGAHHRLVVEGMHAVWERWGPAAMDLAILSAGYGLVRADDLIVPYDVQFDEFDEPGLAAWAATIGIPQQAVAMLRQYDLAIVLLAGPPLAILGLPLYAPASVQQVLLTDAESAARMRSASNLHPIVAANGTAARRWHVKTPLVCSFLFRRLCDQIVRNGPALLDWLYRRPQETEHLFYKRARWEPQLQLW